MWGTLFDALAWFIAVHFLKQDQAIGANDLNRWNLQSHMNNPKPLYADNQPFNLWKKFKVHLRSVLNLFRLTISCSVPKYGYSKFAYESNPQCTCFTSNSALKSNVNPLYTKMYMQENITHFLRSYCVTLTLNPCSPDVVVRETQEWERGSFSRFLRPRDSHVITAESRQ